MTTPAITYVSHEDIYKLFTTSHLAEIELMDKSVLMKDEETKQNPQLGNMEDELQTQGFQTTNGFETPQKTEQAQTVTINETKENRGPGKRVVKTPSKLKDPSMIWKNYTPKIIKGISTPDQKQITEDFAIDDEELMKYFSDYETDPDYVEAISDTVVGKYMEYHLALNMKCPECEGDLKCYYSNYMPIIDMVCISKNHDPKYPKYFQVKTKIGNSIYFGNFKISEKIYDYVFVGSKRYGYNSHCVKASANDDAKRVVIGYICITVEQGKGDNENIYTIANAYALLPDLSKKDDYEYYKYDTCVNSKKCGLFHGKDFIVCEPKLVEKRTIKGLPPINTTNMYNVIEISAINPKRSDAVRRTLSYGNQPDTSQSVQKKIKYISNKLNYLLLKKLNY